MSLAFVSFHLFYPLSYKLRVDIFEFCLCISSDCSSSLVMIILCINSNIKNPSPFLVTHIKVVLGTSVEEEVKRKQLIISEDHLTNSRTNTHNEYL